jgi:hypothetical protein
MLLIGEHNYQEHVDESERRGHADGCLRRLYTPGSCYRAKPATFRPFPESEWTDRIRAMKGRFLGDLERAAKLPNKDQGKLKYCWAFSLAACLESLRLRQGLPYCDLAAESLGGSVGFQNVGNSLDAAIAFAAKQGICRRSFVSPGCIDSSRFLDGWQVDAIRHLPVQWDDLEAGDPWALTVTAILQGDPVYAGYDWWRHCVKLTGLDIVDNEIVVEFRNPWGNWGDNGYAHLSGRHKIPSCGSFVPRVVWWSNV